MLLFSLAIWLVALFFFTVSALLAVALRKAALAIQLAYATVFISYAFAVLFDIDKRFESLRLLTPLKYFRTNVLLANDFPCGFAVAVIIMSLLAFTAALLLFQKKDLLDN